MNEIFINDHYRVLNRINGKKTSVDNKEYCPLSQNDIAKDLKMSRTKVNKIYNDLKNIEYIEMISKGKWNITKKAQHFLKLTKKLI